MLKIAAAVTAVAALLVLSDSARMSAFDHQQRTERYEDIYYLPPPDWLALGSLGYRDALASLVWVDALVDFGEALSHPGQDRYFFNYVDAILALDPDFKRVYRWAGVVPLYRPVPATEEEGLRAASYLERGHARFPQDPEMAWDLAACYAYELPHILRNNPEALARVEKKAAEYFQVAALLGGGPPWIGLNAARRLTDLGQSEQAMRHLIEIYGTVDDPDTKAQIEARLAKVQEENFIMAMRATSEELSRNHKRDFPYLDPSLYILTGERQERAAYGLLLGGFDPRHDQLQQHAPAD